MTSLSPDTVRRIEDAAAALIAAGTANPTNEQVRAHLGGGSLSHISPVMRAFRARQREQRAEQLPALPPELAQLLTGQLGLLWQAAVKQADADTLRSLALQSGMRSLRDDGCLKVIAGLTTLTEVSRVTSV